MFSAKDRAISTHSRLESYFKHCLHAFKLIMLFSLKLAIFSKRSTCLDEYCHEEIFKIIIFQLEKWTWNFS